MKNYNDLEVYQLSYELALEVHALTMQLPVSKPSPSGSRAASRYVPQQSTGTR